MSLQIITRVKKEKIPKEAMSCMVGGRPFPMSSVSTWTLNKHMLKKIGERKTENTIKGERNVA